jgi:2-polyprenyl-3-methyl-5-hydroxy-6-metoxy-1,4-benzoquinol methylase
MKVRPVGLTTLHEKTREHFLSLRRSFAYRIFKRKLKQYGGLNKDSAFSILDVGCGQGYFLLHIKKWFPNCELHGLDADKNMLDIAATHLQRATLIRCDAHDLDSDEASFDVVAALQIVEHLAEPEKFISEANRVLKPKGLLFLTTPNPVGICARMLKENWHPDCIDHISLKSPQQWRNIIMDSGFSMLDDGTTGLTGFQILHRLPFAIINWIPMAVFGYFPWYRGEGYIAIARKI